MEKVIVYRFKGFDIAADEAVIPERMATMDFIRKNRLTPLMDTGKEVDSSDVDGNGRYPKIGNEKTADI